MVRKVNNLVARIPTVDSEISLHRSSPLKHCLKLSVLIPSIILMSFRNLQHVRIKVTNTGRHPYPMIRDDHRIGSRQIVLVSWIIIRGTLRHYLELNARNLRSCVPCFAREPSLGSIISIWLVSRPPYFRDLQPMRTSPSKDNSFQVETFRLPNPHTVVGRLYGSDSSITTWRVNLPLCLSSTT